MTACETTAPIVSIAPSPATMRRPGSPPGGGGAVESRHAAAPRAQSAKHPRTSALVTGARMRFGKFELI
jgi:hypothetical protein